MVSEIGEAAALYLGGLRMANKVFRIEMRVGGVDSKERMDALTEALRNAGRQLHAAATLICGDSSPPEIELSGEDLSEGTTEIKL